MEKGYKYKEIENDLFERINQGDYQVGEIIPSEQELCAYYNASRSTIRTALQNLVLKGMLVRKRGIGTLVQNTNFINYSGRKQSFTEDMIINGKVPGSKLIEFCLLDLKDLPDIRNQLELKAEEKAIYFVRVRTGDDIPIALSHTYLPHDLFSNLSFDILENGSLYKYISTVGKIDISYFAGRTISAVMPTPEQKRLLKIGNEPLLRIAHISQFEDGTIFEYSITYYVGSRFVYTHAGDRRKF